MKVRQICVRCHREIGAIDNPWFDCDVPNVCHECRVIIIGNEAESVQFPVEHADGGGG